MPTDAEREALWRIVAGRDVDGSGRTASQVVTTLLAAGYHNGPRLPAPETPEWDAAVERMLGGWYGAKSWKQAQKTAGDRTVALIRADANRALHALLGGKDNG